MTAATFPADTNSLLAPILIGLRANPANDQLINNAWLAATVSIPITRPTFNVAVAGNKTQAVRHLRIIARSSGGSSWSHVARLCDSRPNEDNPDSYWPRWRWEVALRRVPPADARKLIDGDRTVIRFDVLSYRLSQGHLLEAQQLALFRHHLITGLQAIDPDLTVQGGQHDWHDNWWPDTEAAGSR